MQSSKYNFSFVQSPSKQKTEAKEAEKKKEIKQQPAQEEQSEDGRVEIVFAVYDT